MTKEQAFYLSDKGIIIKTLCKIGLHKWEPILFINMFAMTGDKCKHCRLVRQFNIPVGYLYGHDEKDRL